MQIQQVKNQTLNATLQKYFFHSVLQINTGHPVLTAETWKEFLKPLSPSPTSIPT